MPLKVYNTLTRKKEIFKPLKDGEVGIYTCGPTVYSYQHIGNLRSYFFSDILKRVLKINGYRVKQIINVTDVGHLTSDEDEGEDKVEKAAEKEGKRAGEITQFYFGKFEDDLKKMNISFPSKWVWASKHIPEIIDLIKILEKKGYVYKTSDGIYFDTSKFRNYGKFGKLNLKKVEVGRRITSGEKKSKTDFALWKFSENGRKRQQEWKSPWGVGFPGWHIECSAMSMKYLGKTIDIHTGGMDHIPIHHQNEIAQSEAATGKKFVNYWLHGAFLIFQGKKISKSTGGLYVLEDLEKKGYSPQDLRYFYLSAHYRKPLSFSLENLNYAKNTLRRLREILLKLKKFKGKKNNKNIEGAFQQFLDYLNDDLNTPRAVSYMWEILRDNRLNNSEKYELVLKFDEILGLNLGEVEEDEVGNNIKKLAEEREKFREKKDFISADKIRKKIVEKGYILEDISDGYIIKKRG
jgi:cysteinyl-tRNA synthetase